MHLKNFNDSNSCRSDNEFLESDFQFESASGIELPFRKIGGFGGGFGSAKLSSKVEGGGFTKASSSSVHEIMKK